MKLTCDSGSSKPCLITWSCMLLIFSATIALLLNGKFKSNIDLNTLNRRV